MTTPNIHSSAIIEEGAVISDGTVVGPFCHVGSKVVLEKKVVLKSHVNVQGRTHIGEHTQVSSFTFLGGAPQHIGYRGEDTALIIGKNNDIRENVTMNIGTVQGRGETVIGDGGLFMTGCHIGHDCIVRNNVIFANNATLGGHVVVGDHVFVGGLSAIHQNCHVGSYAFIGGYAAVTYDLIPYGSANGIYADLVGLNLIGMKRRGMSREVIQTMRQAFKALFSKTDSFQERVEEVSSKFSSSPEVMRIIDFINSDRTRPIMLPAYREEE